MICTISGETMYLIEGTTNQTHQANIYSLRETSDTDIFFIDSTICPLHTNMAPKTSATAIVFFPHCRTPSTTFFNPASPINQRLQQNFQPASTGRQVITENTTFDTLHLAQNGCDLSKILPLLYNLTLTDDTLISLKLL